LENNFVKLEIAEIISKFHRLVKEKIEIKLWTKGSDSVSYKCKQVRVLKKESRITMVFFSEKAEIETAMIGKTLYINFELNELAYFSEGKISKFEDNGFEFVIEEPVYRTESRINTRLLTFPHHKVYAFFEIPENVKETTNIVQLNKSVEKGYDNYKSQQKEKLLERLASHIGECHHLTDFRVLDISVSGAAFLVQSAHKGFFENLKNADLTVLFEDSVFQIQGAKTVYVVDYLSGDQSKATESLYKVGMTYHPLASLAQKINSIIHSSEKLDSMRREFEDFKGK